MSTRTEITLIDDLDGSPADGPVLFALDRQAYEIDLSAANETALRDSLARFIAVARKISAGKRQRPPAGVAAATRQLSADGAAHRAEVRAWGIAHPREVAAAGLPPTAERGRIAAGLFALYDERAR